MRKALMNFLFFLAVSVIVALPTFRAFYGPAVHRSSHHIKVIKRHVIFEQANLDHCIHDASWDLIKKRSLSALPLIIKLKSASLIYLLIAFLAVNLLLLSSKKSSLKFYISTSTIAVQPIYLSYRSLLI
ncbi:hypothetical protein [Mucilaginibacter glaciei]|uniref:Uncharacterized protein n=1 Tax=Mucilaginibacter glaciei TaxID=2772109 RepID=A0A926NMF5_9SPHI|nr:hypothetical protein [Mucilaginibacter glaciei]MBD1392371.1 hypothetical protein [Mucilaginibacter glaciei]